MTTLKFFIKAIAEVLEDTRIIFRRKDLWNDRGKYQAGMPEARHKRLGSADRRRCS